MSICRGRSGWNTRRRTHALCRCSHCGSKPRCDGAHREIGLSEERG
ncbi:hypothetical protein [Nonomuraea typhae]|uniref:Iron-binding zinc finger CDGSH type domain-containing protein n=1 Tax=Nonomuraea typhae TaxID=2603600 RepID=A0ABW7YTR9_9ACTN